MPLSHLNRRRFCHVVAIIPGPSEPDHVEPYIEPLLDEFCSFGPGGEYRALLMIAGTSCICWKDVCFAAGERATHVWCM